jgi:hypothetical protein
MIEQYFASRRPVAPTQQQSKYWPVYPLPAPTSPVQAGLKEAERAAKRGLSIEEYRARVVMVMEHQSNCTFQVGDTVWPVYAKDVKTMGQCRHYDDYGDLDWNDPPFLLSVQSLANKSKSIQCSTGWVTKTRPVTYEGIDNEC